MINRSLNPIKIGIAGAGLMGRLLAFVLIQQGAQVTLFDADIREGKRSCGMTAAGMLTPFAELDSIEPSITEMGIRSLEQWPVIIKQLKRSVYFQQTGSLMLAHAQDRGELSRFRQLYEKNWIESSEQAMQVLGLNEIRALEPDLKQDFHQGLYFPSEAQLCPRDLFSALQKALEEQGVIWRENTKVTGVKPYEIYCADDKYSYDWVFDCRGLGAKGTPRNECGADSSPAGGKGQNDLRGVRGELIELYAPDVHLNRIIRLMHPRYALYIAPRPDHRFIIGASSIESEDMSPISVQTTLELLSAAYSLHSGFAEARILETRVNCRPAFPDNLPRVDVKEGLTSINGLYRHGYLLAPCLVKEAILKL